MPTEMEMRHRERDLLFRILCAKKFNDLDRLIAELMVSMEKEDVAYVKQQILELDK